MEGPGKNLIGYQGIHVKIIGSPPPRHVSNGRVKTQTRTRLPRVVHHFCLWIRDDRLDLRSWTTDDTASRKGSALPCPVQWVCFIIGECLSRFSKEATTII